MNSYEFAVQIRNLIFYYITPKKTPIFKNVSLPIKRVTREKNTALNDVSFSMRTGRTLALLGRNGSGKTTLIKIITGMRMAHEGSVLVFGLPPLKVRHRIGVCLGSTLIYNRLSARENLEYYGRLYGVQNLKNRIEELSEILSFAPVLDNMVETFSFGMKAKLALARALIHSPDLLILDEPTLGIDLPLAKQIRTFVKSLDCTVLLTTHYMDEADELADDLCVIEQGKILTSGTKQEVLDRYGVGTVPEAFTAVIEGNAAKDLVRAAS